MSGRVRASVRTPSAPSSSDDDESTLLLRVARGDVTARRVLYDACAGRAMAIAMRVLRNETAAEDVIQETFLEVWRRAGDFDRRRGGIGAWVTTIAHSRAIDRLRSSTTRSRAIAAASELLIPLPQPLPSDGMERSLSGRWTNPNAPTAWRTFPRAGSMTAAIKRRRKRARWSLAWLTSCPITR